MIKKYISDFWQWAFETTKKREEEYRIEGFDQNLGEFEDDFPGFYEMIQCAKDIVNKNSLDENELFDLLTVTALDNESGNVIDHITECSSDEQLEIIIKIGLQHPQMNVRWQIIQLLVEKKPEGYFEKIKKLTHDEAPYARSHARNCLNYVRYGDRWEKHIFDLFAQKPLKNKCILSEKQQKPMCEFCMYEIGTKYLPVGYTDANYELWVCETCFNDYEKKF